MNVLVLLDPTERDVRAVFSPEGDVPAAEVNRYFDPPDLYWETQAQSTLDQKLEGMSWTDFMSQLPDRVPAVLWWEWVDVKAKDLPSAFAELVERANA